MSGPTRDGSIRPDRARRRRRGAAAPPRLPRSRAIAAPARRRASGGGRPYARWPRSRRGRCADRCGSGPWRGRSARTSLWPGRRGEELLGEVLGVLAVETPARPQNLVDRFPVAPDQRLPGLPAHLRIGVARGEQHGTAGRGEAIPGMGGHGAFTINGNRWVRSQKNNFFTHRLKLKRRPTPDAPARSGAPTSWSSGRVCAPRSGTAPPAAGRSPSNRAGKASRGR